MVVTYASQTKTGNRVYLISGRNILWDRDFDGTINNVIVNRNGYVAVARADSSYRTVIEIFNTSGTLLFRTFLATSNIIDMSISNDNRYLAIAEANLSGIIIQSNIRIISIENAQTNPSEATVFTHTSEPGNLIIRINYNNRNNLISMYDNRIDSIIQNNRNEKLISFSNGNTLFVDISLDSRIAKIVRESTGIFSSTTKLKLLDSNNINRVNGSELLRNTKKRTCIWQYGRYKSWNRSIIYK